MVGGADSATLPYVVIPIFHGHRLFNSPNSVSFTTLCRLPCLIHTPTITGTPRVLSNDLILPATAEMAACMTTVLNPDHARLAVYAPPCTVLLNSCFNNQGTTFISFN